MNLNECRCYLPHQPDGSTNWAYCEAHGMLIRVSGFASDAEKREHEARCGR